MSVSTVTAAAINRAVKALESAGHQVRAARLYPDGSVALLTDEAAVALPAPADTSWVEMAGEPEARAA